MSYNLDEGGNRLSVNQNGAALGYTPDSLNQYQVAEGNTVVNSDNHQLGTFQGKSYTYIHDEHLQSVTTPDGFYWLGYDALGRCVIRSVNYTTVAYVYDGERAIGEYDSTQELVGSALYGIGMDEVLMHANQEVAHYLHQDRLGSVTAATSYTGY